MVRLQNRKYRQYTESCFTLTDAERLFFLFSHDFNVCNVFYFFFFVVFYIYAYHNICTCMHAYTLHSVFCLRD